MMKRMAMMVGVCALAVAIVPKPAPAATEFGDNCGGNAFSGIPVTYFALSAIGKGLSLTAPSSGVVTKFKSAIASPGLFPHIFRVLRPNGPGTVLIVGETSATLATGPNAVDARVPIQAGDRLAIFGTGPSGTVYCEYPGPEDSFGGFAGGAVGQSSTFVEVLDEAGIPVAAVIEPDADNDGFGDETQDKCPQNAATHGDCPPPSAPVTLSASAVAKKALITVLITSSGQSSVTVTGSAKLGKGKTAKLNGGTQIIAPGVLARFVVPVPQAVTRKLKQLGPKRRLTVDLTATGTNQAGSPTVTTLKAKLKGQAKPKPKRSKGNRP
jgi:hypothetical protein